MCAYGKTDSRGQLQYKPMKFMTSDPESAKILARKCSRDHQHSLVSGQETKGSQVYPVDLVDSILEVLRHKAAERWPWRWDFAGAAGLSRPRVAYSTKMSSEVNAAEATGSDYDV